MCYFGKCVLRTVSCWKDSLVDLRRFCRPHLFAHEDMFNQVGKL